MANANSRTKKNASHRPDGPVAGLPPDASLSAYNAIAQAVNLPLWVMFIPGLDPEEMATPNAERLVTMVENYLRCDREGRTHVEGMAAAFAAFAACRA